MEVHVILMEEPGHLNLLGSYHFKDRVFIEAIINTLEPY
jgi:hypothetical protein